MGLEWLAVGLEHDQLLGIVVVEVAELFSKDGAAGAALVEDLVDRFLLGLADNHGVELDSRNWARQWGWVVQLMFDQAGIIDGICLRPVGRVLSEEREAA